MKSKDLAVDVNRNPLVFEELATSLASLASYCLEGDMDMEKPIEEFKHCYTRALSQPAGYQDITELTGQSLNTGDRRSGRAAWLLMNTEKMKVCAVHSLLWHNKGDKYSAPILDQVGLVIGREPALNEKELQMLGRKTSFLDVVGVKDGKIWIVQTLHEKKIVRSAVPQKETPNLFGDNVFHNTALAGKSLQTLYCAYDIMRKAFPGVGVFCVALVLHREMPDFELYVLDITKDRPQKIILKEEFIISNSLDYRVELLNDHQSLWTLPERFDNPLFKGVPPCRGGRTLNILALLAWRQLDMKELLRWKERDFIENLKVDFNFDLPRDKLRHDLVDRLVGQRYVKKWGNEYSLTVTGMARYLYCLAKYTTIGIEDPIKVLEVCIVQRNRVFNYYGCL